MLGLIFPPPRPVLVVRVPRELTPLLTPPPRDLPPRPTRPLDAVPPFSLSPDDVPGLLLLLLLFLSQSMGLCGRCLFWPLPLPPISGSSFTPPTRVRGNQPPLARERKIGLRAGAEAVISARLVSIADVTKPMFVVSGVIITPNRPCTRRTRRTIDVIVTLLPKQTFVSLARRNLSFSFFSNKWR